MHIKITSIDGVEGDISIYDFDLVGEGVIWKPVEMNRYGFDYWFKIKGEAHVKGTSIDGLNLSSTERMKVINFCLENGIKEFDYYFSE